MIPLLQINLNEILWIVLTSVILTLFFDTPFGNIKKLLFKSPRASGKEKSAGELQTLKESQTVVVEEVEVERKKEL